MSIFVPPVISSIKPVLLLNLAEFSSNRRFYRREGINNSKLFVKTKDYIENIQIIHWSTVYSVPPELAGAFLEGSDPVFFLLNWIFAPTLMKLIRLLPSNIRWRTQLFEVRTFSRALWLFFSCRDNCNWRRLSLTSYLTKNWSPTTFVLHCFV